MTATTLKQPPMAVSWIAQLVAAGILGQTLFFKFTGAPEAIAIFTELGVEPWGRIALGVVELIAAVLLLFPKTAVYGGVIGVGLMVGAIGSHMTVLGIESNGDGGALFIMAIVTLIASAIVVLMRRESLPFFK